MHIGKSKSPRDEEWNSTYEAGRRVRCCNTRGKRIAWCGIITTVLITASVLIGVSIKSLDSTEYGLEYNKNAKKLADVAQNGGLHTGPPGFEFIKFPSTYITVDRDDTCVSRDGLRVKYSVTFQYQMPAEWLVPAVKKYRDFDGWSRVVEAAGNSAVQHTCSGYNISDFQNKRGLIQKAMEESLRAKLEGTEGNLEVHNGAYAFAISLQLRNVEVPEDYQEAIREKQAAQEDIALAQNQRTQKITQAQTQLLAAKEEAQKILDTANNDANVTLTEAALKSEETLFAFETEATVIIQIKESLNLTTEGVLAYMANKLYEEAQQLRISAAEPAKISQRDEL